MIRLAQAAATGDGGTCYGDSGGAQLSRRRGRGGGAGIHSRRRGNETTILAGTTLSGDGTCKAASFIYRLDTASARAFLGHFVQSP